MLLIASIVACGLLRLYLRRVPTGMILFVCSKHLGYRSRKSINRIKKSNSTAAAVFKYDLLLSQIIFVAIHWIFWFWTKPRSFAMVHMSGNRSVSRWLRPRAVLFCSSARRMVATGSMIYLILDCRVHRTTTSLGACPVWKARIRTKNCWMKSRSAFHQNAGLKNMRHSFLLMLAAYSTVLRKHLAHF